MSLQSERKKRHITTDDIAYHTGISRRTIEAYESGQRDIRKASYDSLAKIAKFIGVPIEKLIEEEVK
jgi:transcriptional regulator with XRE-family HTH domain